MEATISVKEEKNRIASILKEFIKCEVDLEYDKRQNILMACGVDGCNRISYCSCDCNDGAC